jgi:hypothetical protein
MVQGSVRVASFLLVLPACGLERDWERWEVAALSWTEWSSSSGGSSSSEDDADPADSGESSTGESSTGASGDGGTSGTTASTATSTGPDATSEGPTPFCGDGQVDRTLGEECDDADPATCVQCRRVRRIFVLSLYLQGGKINGLTGADAYCRSQALKAMQALPDSPIVDPTSFKALLSTSTESIADRHFFGEGPYRLINDLPVSDSFAQLFSEPLKNPINVDEFSQTQSATVWTGTNADGEPYPGIDFCADWKDIGGTANWGHSDYVDGWWLHVDIPLNPQSCGAEMPIYCVEQE